jgi:hypothetical protein
MPGLVAPRPDTFIRGEKTPLPIDYESEWVPRPVWTFWRRDKYFASAGIRTPDCPAQSLITTQTGLSRLLRNTVPSFLLSITNKMQCYTIFFIAVNALHVSDGSSAHHQELKTVHTAFGLCQACLLLQLAVAASNSSKLNIYQMLCLQFWAPDDGRRNRLKHVEH